MENKKEYKGLSGWLILVGIGVVFAPIRVLVNTVKVFHPIFTDGIWEALTTVGSAAYNPLWGPLLIGEIIFNVAMMIALIYLIYLFFSKHYRFPMLYIAIVAISLVFIPLDAWLVSFILPNAPIFDQETTGEFVRVLIGGIIWVPYMLLSKRVKATFVGKMPGAEFSSTEYELAREEITQSPQTAVSEKTLSSGDKNPGSDKVTSFLDANPLSIGTLDELRKGQKDFGSWGSGVLVGTMAWIVDKLSSKLSEIGAGSLYISPSEDYSWQNSKLKGFTARIQTSLSNGMLAGYYIGRIGDDIYGLFGYGFDYDEEESKQISTTTRETSPEAWKKFKQFVKIPENATDNDVSSNMRFQFMFSSEIEANRILSALPGNLAEALNSGECWWRGMNPHEGKFQIAWEHVKLSIGEGKKLMNFIVSSGGEIYEAFLD
jgi:hypothetical protein